MRLIFTGVGGAFAEPDQYQNNAALIDDDGTTMLIDCGSDARHALREQAISLPKIEAVYISHLHADHVGGMEWLAFCTYFNPNLNKPELFCDAELMGTMWSHSLRGGLDSIEGWTMNLENYFICRSIASNGGFDWHGALCETVQTVHVMAGRTIVHSYGLMITSPSDKRVFYTSDTQFCPSQIKVFYENADIIFQDCETTPFRSNVHAHLDDLKTLPDDIKRKMWLMHYALIPNRNMMNVALENGFAGFVRKGRTFEL